MWWHETCGGASMRKLRNVAHREKHAADTPYPLPAQSFHHRIQAVVRQHHGGGGGLTTLQLLLQFRNLPFQRLVLLLETMSLKGIKSEQVCAVCVCIRIHCFTAEGTWRADVSLGAETVFVLTSSISRTRRSLRAAMTVRSWTNRVRPSLLSSLAATKSNLSQSHLSTAAPLRGHTEPETGLNSERSDRRSSDWLELKVVDWKK